MAEYTVNNTLGLFTTRERMGIDGVKNSFLDWLSIEDAERQEKYKQYRAYYDGEHEVMLTKRQAAFLELSSHQHFSANYCPLVVDELERRMTVDSFDAPGELGGHDGVLWKWWRLARMDSKQSDAHLSAIRDGDSYVIVSWNSNKGRPEFHHNLAYDGTEGVKVVYSDETGEISLGIKHWLITDAINDAGERRRMNLYYPDRVERWVSSDNTDRGAWKPFTDDGQPGILDWRDKSGIPLGVPVFHLKYKPAGWRWGKSILEDVIPLQNALNKSIVAVIAAADTTGFRLYWVTGTDMVDENGDPIEIHPGSILVSPSPDARIGHIPGEDLRPLIEVVDMCKVSIAQVSETPMHLFQVSGQNASEGAQKQQEVGMINKAEKYGVHVGNFWEDAMQMAIRLSNTFANTSYPTDAVIQTVWKDMEVRDKTARRKEIAETAKIWTDAGAGIEIAAKTAGLDEETAQKLSEFAIPLMTGAIMPGRPAANADSSE